MSVRPKKHLGQHFLKDSTVVHRTVEAIDASKSMAFLEIGPGMGVLTMALLEKLPQLMAVDLDAESIQYLKEHINNPNLRLAHEDVLKMDWATQFGPSLSVLGNFPYNISSQILFKCWEHCEQVTQLVGMFQKEVAVRVCSKEGNKDYGILSVLLQAYYDCELLFDIPPGAFNPPPKVTSSVIKLSKKSELPDLDKNHFRKVVKMAFGQRRKKISNALKPLLQESVEGCEKFLNLRAEQLSVSDFLTLSRSLQHGAKYNQ